MPTNRKPRPRPPTARGRTDPQPPGGTFLTPGASAFRHAVERRSAGALLRLHQAPRWIVAVGMVALLLLGAGAPRWFGALAFLTLGAFLSWLCFLSWPALQPRGRLLRTVAILVVVAAAVARGTGILG